MVVTKLKMELNRKSVPSKTAFGGTVSENVKNNPTMFTGATAFVTALTNANDKLIASYATSRNGSKADYAVMRADERSWTVAMKAMAGYVQGVANASASPDLAEQIILTAGFALAKKPEPAKTPEPVSKIQAIFSNLNGSVLLKWKGSRYSRLYKVQMTTTPDVNTSWKDVTELQGRKLLVDSLISGTRYYFRIVSVGKDSSSEPSAVVSQLAA